jgi:hypothetical protein
MFEDFVDFMRPDGLVDFARRLLLRVLFQLSGILDGVMRFFPTRAKARSKIVQASDDRVEIELVSGFVLHSVNDDAYIEAAISAEVLILDDLV